jgi:hypothetical protein
MTETPGAFKVRIIEVGITAAISIIASAVTITWTLSGVLSKVEERAMEQDRRLIVVEKTTIKNSEVLAAVQAREDGTDKFREEMLNRLDRMENKIDRVLERRRQADAP